MYRNYFKAFTYLLVIFFFLTSVIPHILGAENTNQGTKEISFIKSLGVSAGSNVQLPFEEREEENVCDNPSPLLFTYLISTLSVWSSHASLTKYHGGTKSVAGSMPIYLTKRSLLI